MDNAVALPARNRVASLARPDLTLLGSWLLPFVLVVYLALKGGGYDAVLRGEVGIAVWWIVLIGALAGVLPVARIGRTGWAALGLLAAFAAWTALGIGWSESAERSVAELGRVAMYLGVFALALSLRGPRHTRRTVNALSAAIALVAGFALLSRLHPAWFPANQTAEFLGSASRLSHPLNYWNGLAVLVAMGIPLALAVAGSARTLLARALAAAAVPMMALTILFTFSRNGTASAIVGALVFVALAPNRAPKIASLLLTATGSAILIAGATQRDALSDGLLNEAARRQGDEMLAMALVVCVGVALVQVAISLATRYGRLPRWLSPSPGRAAAIFAASLVTLTAVSLAAGLPGELSQRWQDFKQPAGPSGSGVSRFSSSYGGGRYQYWQSAGKANATDSLRGIGPGTFEFWWARESTVPGFIRDTHSLYMQTLAEAGIVGLALLSVFLALALGAGAIRALSGNRGRRPYVAAATAGSAVFCVSATADWIWQITVLPVALLLLAAVALGAGSRQRRTPRSARRAITARATLAILAVVSLFAVAIPLAGVASVRESRQAVQGSRLATALHDARTAVRAQPYAATPRLQEALVLELQGDLIGATAAAQVATIKEPTNWRTWVVLSRLEAERGHAKKAVAAYEQARSLNPRSPLFQQ